MNNPVISVVMPVYNGARYIRESIESILNQTYKDFELIIINDGSTDNSEEIVLSYTDPRIVYLKNEVNSKICVTLNRGLDAARGEYIARLDCDDIAMPNRLERQKQYLDEHPEIGIVGSDIITFGEGREDRYFDFVHDPDGCRAGLLFNTCFAHPAVMMRTSIIREHNLHYREEYKGLEDFEMWWRISQHAKMTNIPEALIRYRKHPGQETQNVSASVAAKSTEFIHERFRSYVPTLTDKELKVIANYCYAKWSELDDDALNILISICKQIMHSPQVRASKSFSKALAITLSKAIVWVKSNCPAVKQCAWSIDNKALFAGIMPFDWYLKFSFHHIFRR